MPSLPSFLTSLALTVLFVAAAPLVVEATSSETGVRAVGMQASVTGTVVAVDAEQRTVTVKGPQGLDRSYAVDPSVALDSVKTGDLVRLDYQLAVAVALRKGGDGIREKVEAEAEARVAQDGKPGLQANRRTTLVTHVLAVDRQRQTVRLQGPQGRVADFTVKDKAALADVKAGDQVVAVVYEAIAVGMKPATQR
ncbi:copper-binding protein [Aquabacterium sp. A7-Y]|uniref:hypothetical protein n=1 Tax=Aquabacterium sp. A7-Y TaxID=1349605 RepID=UPI00223DE7AE|nr:hypothetical protein [Aquabacterium sp. A7-Y]MCW7538435.1 copper-binding protein [Aquabacterium sp. A7-Y]